MEQTAVEWLRKELESMDTKSYDRLIQIEMDRDNFIHICEQAKEMAKQEKHAEYMRGWKDGYSCKSIKNKIK